MSTTPLSSGVGENHNSRSAKSAMHGEDQGSRNPSGSLGRGNPAVSALDQGVDPITFRIRNSGCEDESLMTKEGGFLGSTGGKPPDVGITIGSQQGKAFNVPPKTLDGIYAEEMEGITVQQTHPSFKRTVNVGPGVIMGENMLSVDNSALILDEISP